LVINPMDFTELILESFGTLRLNRVRTGLAMLGVVIGIGSVIALVSLGQASQKSIETQIKSLGSNLLTISPGAQMEGGIRGAQGGSRTLTNEDAAAIASSPEVTAISQVAPEYSSRSQVVAGRNNTNTQVVGVTPEYVEVRNLGVSSGSFISDSNLEARSKVAVLGPQTVTDLFGENANPVGQTIRIEGQAFSVIGVTASKGGTGFQNQDDRVYIPLTTAQKVLFGVNHLSSIGVTAQSEAVMEEARNQIGYLLLARHKLKDPTQADFSIFSQEDILGTATQVTSTFTTLLSGIAAISLVVGGIGIMNIMLVTVTERTREIGLRKALGAKKKIITYQFLIEAVIITFVGGLIGALVGILVSSLLTNYMSLPFTISLAAILLAFGVSTGIGILFGWYPARKAANLEPIEALRYE
jgi:putative ABC transport system permease protein